MSLLQIIHGIITITSCEDYAIHDEYDNAVIHVGDGLRIDIIEFNGNRHEFLRSRNTGLIGHWPDCRYCKESGDSLNSNHRKRRGRIGDD